MPEDHLRPDAKPTEIEDVLRYYNQKFNRYLAAAMAERDFFPEEVLNEVRGAFTHLAKAEACGRDTPHYYDENKSAMRHLKRASLDCLKVAIIYVAERLETQLEALTTYVRLPQKVYIEAYRLKEQRRIILNTESSHPSLTAIEDLESLYVDLATLEKNLIVDYDSAYIDMINTKAKQKEDKSSLVGFGWGIASSILATLFLKIFGI